MFIDGEKSTGETVSQERRDGAQNDRRIIGHVIQCDGARARIAAYAHSSDTAIANTWTVGRMISSITLSCNAGVRIDAGL